MIGVGIIGCGAISKMHIEAYNRCPDTQVIAVCGHSEKSAKSVGEAIGVPWYTDAEEMLDRGDIEIVSICTPSGAHLEPALAAAERGIHAIVEKPIEITEERIDEMIKAFEENGAQLSCIFNQRFAPAHQFVKRAVDAGRFGRIINANAYVRWYRPNDYYEKSSWHGSLKLDGGGALMNQSIHYVDLILWLVGDVENVAGYTATLLHKSIEAEDTAVAALRFKNGALGTIVGTTSVYPGYSARLELSGERGSCIIEDGKIISWDFIDSDELDESACALMHKSDVSGDQQKDPMAFMADNHCLQIARFVQSIKEGREPDVTARDARRSVALIRDIYRFA